MIHKARFFFYLVALFLLACSLLIACGGGDDDDDDDQVDGDDDSDDEDGDDDDDSDDDQDDDDECPDADGDSFADQECGGEDCNDADPEINPDADEICRDNVDQDCDNVADDGCDYWDTQTVLDGYSPSESQRFYSLAFLSDATPVVAYYKPSSKSLNVATGEADGKGWTHAEIDSNGNAGKYASIDVDSNDRIGIAYYQATQEDLRAAFKEPGSEWSTETIDAQGDIGKFAKLRFNTLDKAQVFAFKGGAWYLNHYEETEEGWHFERRFDDPGSGSFKYGFDVDMESHGFAGFAWTHWEDEEPWQKNMGFDFMYAGTQHTLYGWNHYLLWVGKDLNKDFYAFTWDMNDKPMAFFVSEGVAVITVAYVPGESWVLSDLPDQDAGISGPLSADTTSDGAIWLGYTNALSGSPRVAKREGTAWALQDLFQGDRFGCWVHLTAAPDDTAALLYYDQPAGALCYARLKTIPEVE